MKENINNNRNYQKENRRQKDREPLHQDDESVRQQKTTKDFKRKKQSLQDEESWEDWSEYLDD
jgi:hypothetical protein